MRTIVPETGQRCRGLGVTLDARLLVATEKVDKVAVYCVASCKRLAAASCDSAVTACAITPDSTRVFAGDERGRIYVLSFER
jgi:hypothetical protein